MWRGETRSVMGAWVRHPLNQLLTHPSSAPIQCSSYAFRIRHQFGNRHGFRTNYACMADGRDAPGSAPSPTNFLGNHRQCRDTVLHDEFNTNTEPLLTTQGLLTANTPLCSIVAPPWKRWRHLETVRHKPRKRYNSRISRYPNSV